MYTMAERFGIFAVTIDRVAKSLRKYENARVSRYGLRGTHAMCMFRLYLSKDGMTASQLVDACYVDKAFISRVTAELLDGGFLRYEKRHDGTRVRTMLMLTEKGFSVMEELNGVIEESIRRISATYTDEEVSMFYRVLGQIDGALSALCDEEDARRTANLNKENTDEIPAVLPTRE